MTILDQILLGVGMGVITGFFAIAIWQIRVTKLNQDSSEEPLFDSEVEPSFSSVTPQSNSLEQLHIKSIVVSPAEELAVSPEELRETARQAALSSEPEVAVAEPVEAVSAEPVVTEQAPSDPEAKWSQLLKDTFARRVAQRPAPRNNQAADSTFVVVHVMAPHGKVFLGGDVYDVLRQHGLQFGQMDLFHQRDPSGFKLFSVASAVEPGQFDLDAMGFTSMPGLSCFFDIKKVHQPRQSFRALLSCVHELAHFLQGELYDENREKLTQSGVVASLNRIKTLEANKATA